MPPLERGERTGKPQALTDARVGGARSEDHRGPPSYAPGHANLLRLQRSAGNRATRALLPVQRDGDEDEERCPNECDTRAWYEQMLGLDSQSQYEERQRCRICQARARSRREVRARDRDPSAWPLAYVGGPPRVYEQSDGVPRDSSRYAGTPDRPYIVVDDLILPTNMSAHTVRRVFPELAQQIEDGPSMLDLAIAVLGDAPPDYEVAMRVKRITGQGDHGDFRVTVKSVIKLGENELVEVGRERTYDRRGLSSELSTHNVLTATRWWLAATAAVIQNSLPAARAGLLANAGRAILGMGARAAVRSVGASVRRRLPRISLNVTRAAVRTYAREIQAAEYQNQVRGRGRTVPPEIHDRAVARATTAAVNAGISGLFGAATGLDSDSPIGATLGEWFRGQVMEFVVVDFSSTVLTAMTNVATDQEGDVGQRLWSQVGTGMRDALLARVSSSVGSAGG